MKDRSEVRGAVFERIAGTRNPPAAGRSKLRLGESCVHTRFCSENWSSPTKYKFNVNHNTLTADYELWICGDPDQYYLIPVSIMRRIYDHPDAYVDNRHRHIRVVSVDIEQHRVTYATGGRSLDLSSCYQGRLS